jgi:hypothetical protein
MVPMAILLENKTGKRYGRFVKYEYGEDLFGYLYLEKIKGKKERRIQCKKRQ